MIEEKYEKFCELILKYNKIHNITGAKNKNAVMDNVKDSIYPIQFLDIKDIKTAIDIGTGAGFPGLILAMELPQIHFTLFEPIAKKSSFLHLVKTTLNLQNVNIQTKRVENVEPFEVELISSRAVTNTDLLIKLCKNYIKKSTSLLFYKGQNVEKEINNLKDYTIHNNGNRNYLIIRNVDVI